MAVFAHPDDETCLAGGTLAGCVAMGIRVTLICATHGEAADPCCLPDPVDPPEMARIREAELRCAAASLGLEEVILLELPDGRLAQPDPAALVARLRAYLQSRRPAVVMTFAPDYLDEHPDHVAIGRAATAAAQTIGATLLYIVSDEMYAADETHLVVNIGPWVDHKRRAMRCYRSQASCWREREAALARGEGTVEVYRRAGPPMPTSLTRLLAGAMIHAATPINVPGATGSSRT